MENFHQIRQVENIFRGVFNICAIMNTKLTIRPYARLLTMLGDQLIKNEQIAVLELIKIPMMQMQIG